MAVQQVVAAHVIQYRAAHAHRVVASPLAAQRVRLNHQPIAHAHRRLMRTRKAAGTLSPGAVVGVVEAVSW